MTRRRSGQTPESILDAAEAVIRRDGAARLTIDAVAAEAVLSKGGVLHHFASKDALIAAMVKHQLARMDREITAIEEALPPSRVAPLVALIRHTRVHYGCEDGIPKALLVASAENPTALEGFRAKIAETLATLGEGDEDGGASRPEVLFFAALGLLLTKSLGFFSYDEAGIGKVLDTLEGMATAEARASEGGPGQKGRR